MKFLSIKNEKSKKLIFTLLSAATLISLTACHKESTNDSQTSKDKISITTTFYPVYEFTKNIVGNDADVKLMVPAGSEPHDYEPSAADMKKISESDVFIYHNNNMETWAKKVKNTLKDQGHSPNIIVGTKGMVLLPGGECEEHETKEGHEGHSHEYDPHTWLSPERAIQEVKTIEKQLEKLYPQKAKDFQTNSQKYLDKLSELNKKYTSGLEHAKQKNFITQHAAFRYLAVDYGLNQVPISGLDPNQEPSASRMAKLKNYVSENDIKYIYFENNSNSKLAKTLAEEANVKMSVLNPIESLTTDQINNGEDYISVMEENLASLEKTTTVTGKDVIEPEEGAKTEKTVYNGYFSDHDVKDRTLSDYNGEWKSVYPLLQEGKLDQIFDYKSKINRDMTPSEYKDYYTKGYKSDVSNIKINDSKITFTKNNNKYTYHYKYKGYEILDYEKGNRGVRYLFETDDKNSGEFKYVQFSDHNIAPTTSSHYHIFYGGESQDSILKEVDNWPTFYPEKLSDFDIAQEMMAH